MNRAGLLLCLYLNAGWLSAETQVPEVKRHPRVYKEFLESLKEHPAENPDLAGREPTERIENKNGYLTGTGNDLATLRNNEAVLLLVQGDNARARTILEEVRSKAPEFFPARFNLGAVYLGEKQHARALTEFKTATRLVPQYWRNYIFLGRTSELQGKKDDAAYFYRQAFLRNPYDLEALIRMGDMLLNEDDATEAARFYSHALSQDAGYNDAIIGMGKVNMKARKYFEATLWFRTVDTRLNYAREYHFYYGEAAFYTRNYRLAAEQFDRMLAFPQDPLFDRVSLARVRFRLNQSRRLSLQSETE